MILSKYNRSKNIVREREKKEQQIIEKGDKQSYKEKRNSKNTIISNACTLHFIKYSNLLFSIHEFL